MPDESVLGGGAGNALSGGSTGASTAPGSTGGASGSLTGASVSSSWRDSLPEEIKNDPSISSFTDLPSFTKAFIHTKSLVGKKGVIVPGEKDAPETWSNFYKELGVPDAANYKIEAPKDAKIDPSFLGKYQETAAKLGLLPKQANEMITWYAQVDKEAGIAKEAARAATAKVEIENLKKEWGDGYQREINAAELAAKEFGGEELKKLVADSGLRDSVPLIKMFAKVAKLMGEDRLREGGIGDGSNTPEEITREMAEIRANGMTNGYFDSKHPQHGLIMAKMESLGKRLTGGR